MVLEKNNLTKILFTHNIFSVLEMIYNGRDVRYSCNELKVPLTSFYYARNQLFKFYNTNSMYVLLHKLVMEGLIKDI